MKPHDICIAIVHTDVGTNPSPDDADTIVQAEFIASSLKERGYKAPLLPFRPETLKDQLRKNKALCIFNLVEAVDGKDERSHEAAAFFETLGLHYSGNPAATLEALLNKPVVKRKLQQHNLPTPAFPEDGGQGKQWILKSETFHCSRGMDHRNISNDIDALNILAQECAAQYGGDWFLEEYIPGREINIALLDNGTLTPDVLPASEICFHGQEPHIVDYDCKWNEDSDSYKSATASMSFRKEDKPLLNKLQELSRECWNVFNLSGYARVDFRVDPAGNPYILEINANPCLSDDAGFMRAARFANLTPADVVDRLIAPALAAKNINDLRSA